MSLNPYDLLYGDEVIFGGKVLRKVKAIIKGNIYFDDGHYLEHDDSLWELAELGRKELPVYLCLWMLDNSGENYVLKDIEYLFSPSRLLNRLRRDVALLEAVGVKEEEE